MSVFFFILFGQGLKLGPINFIDEAALAVGSIKINNWRKVKYNFTFYFGLYFFVIHVLGFLFYFELNAIRLAVMGLLIMLTSGYKIDFFSKKAVLALWLYPIVISAICIWEILNGMHYWHQQWLWSGTAYSALGLVVSAICASIFYSQSRLLSLMHIILSVFAAIITDSRTTLILVLGLLVIWFLETVLKTVTSVKRLFYGVVFGIILIMVLFKTQELYRDQLDSAVDTINAIFGNSHRESDKDRMNQMAVIGDYLSQANLFQIVFGNGGESYKYILVEFMGSDAHATRRIVRPTGFPAFLILGGLLFIFTLYTKIIYNIVAPFLSKRITAKSLFVNMKISYMHCVILIFPLITNVIDSVLYFVLILFANDFKKISRSLTV